MKRLYITQEYRRFNKYHADRSLRDRLLFREYRREKNRGRNGVSSETLRKQNAIGRYRQLGYQVVSAPAHFELRRNPELMVKFIETMRSMFDKSQRVFVDLREVLAVDYDAIVLLISMLVRFKSQNIDFTGNYPQDGSVHAELWRSGFYTFLKRIYLEQDRYDLSPELTGAMKTKNSAVFTHAYRRVDSQLSATIIAEATQLLWGRSKRCPGVQQALIELMLNTHNHAAPIRGEKHWWLSYKYDEYNQKVCFSFIDYGRGVFRTLSEKEPQNVFFKALERMKETLGLQTDSDSFREILNGELHRTATGEYNRGKGLPGIYESMLHNKLSNLHFITNNVYADVASGVYRQLHNTFQGTYIYWELNINSNHIN